MHRVVVHEGRHSNHIHGHVHRHDEEHAQVLTLINGNDVVLGLDLDPSALEKEENIRIGMVALRHDDTLFFDKGPLCLRNTVHDPENE